MNFWHKAYLFRINAYLTLILPCREFVLVTGFSLYTTRNMFMVPSSQTKTEVSLEMCNFMTFVMAVAEFMSCCIYYTVLFLLVISCRKGTIIIIYVFSKYLPFIDLKLLYIKICVVSSQGSLLMIIFIAFGLIL